MEFFTMTLLFIHSCYKNVLCQLLLTQLSSDNKTSSDHASMNKNVVSKGNRWFCVERHSNIYLGVFSMFLLLKYLAE